MRLKKIWKMRHGSDKKSEKKKKLKIKRNTKTNFLLLDIPIAVIKTDIAKKK